MGSSMGGVHSLHLMDNRRMAYGKMVRGLDGMMRLLLRKSRCDNIF